MNMNEYLKWNQEGLIPGPTESEDAYCKRATYCLELKEEIAGKLPFSEKASTLILPPVLDISPKWIPIFFSNYKLAPWHGGCAWIFQVTEDSPTAALIQLRKSLKNSTRYLKIYSRDELIAHELAHVGRMAFEEPKFEEVHAYQTSNSNFRKWFGPIVQSSKESLLFILLLAFTLWLDVALPFVLLVMTLALGRLALRSWQYIRCKRNLRKILSDEAKVNALIYRLTDEEIIDFGKIDKPQVLEYIEARKRDSFRWQVLFAAYF